MRKYRGVAQLDSPGALGAQHEPRPYPVTPTHQSNHSLKTSDKGLNNNQFLAECKTVRAYSGSTRFGE